MSYLNYHFSSNVLLKWPEIPTYLSQLLELAWFLTRHRLFATLSRSVNCCESAVTTALSNSLKFINRKWGQVRPFLNWVSLKGWSESLGGQSKIAELRRNFECCLVCGEIWSPRGPAIISSRRIEMLFWLFRVLRRLLHTLQTYGRILAKILSFII